MTWFLLLLLVTTTVTALPVRETPESLASRSKESVSFSENEVPSTKDDAKGSAREQMGRTTAGTKDRNSLPSILPQDTRNGKPEASRNERHHEAKEKTKKGRKHKAIFANYPVLPRIHFPKIPTYEVDYDNEYDYDVEQRTRGTEGNGYQESNIFYIRLPPTPYMFVPGLGYISQPPTYSTAGLRPQIPHVRPSRPQSVYHQSVNPFIKLPIDFVSNGKPTSVYQWQKRKPTKKPADSPITNLDNLSADFVSNGKPTSIYQWQTNLKPSRRPDDVINSLDKGPYSFNGKPTSFFLLKPDGTSTGHQNIRYPDYRDENAYY